MRNSNAVFWAGGFEILLTVVFWAGFWGTIIWTVVHFVKKIW